MTTIATLTNSGSASITFLDINKKVYTIAGSGGTLQLPASQISYNDVASAMSKGVLTISNWSVPNTVQVYENTAAGWTSSTTVLGKAFIGLETDTYNVKIGDGRTAWASLPYITGGYYALFNNSIPVTNLVSTTTNATPTVMTIDGLAAGANNQIVLPNNVVALVTGKVSTRDTLTGNTSTWTFSGAIKRGANAASTAAVAAITPTLVAQDSGASTWALAVAADTTNGGVKVTFTGAASTNIVAVARVEATMNIL
jgi:hypothetical protein